MTNSVTDKNEKAYDEHASDWYAAMDTNFGHKYLEKPAMISQLPGTLQEKSVLCIGVGSGEELSELLIRKPKHVVAIDISNKLLEITKSHFPEVELHKMDMMKLDLPEENFDFIYSSLTFHYANDWDKLLGGVSRVLKKSGQLLFSTHNPDYWSTMPSTGNSHTNDRGIKVSEHQAILPGGVDITYYNHENKDNIHDALEHAGFSIKNAFEPVVQEVVPKQFNKIDASDYEVLKTKNAESPLFYIVNAVKK